MKSTVNIDGKEVSVVQIIAAFVFLATLSAGSGALLRNFWCKTPVETFGPTGKKVATAFLAVVVTKALVDVTDIVADFVMSRAKPAQAEED